MIHFDTTKVIQLLGGDQEFLRQAFDEGLVSRAAERFDEDEVSQLLVARTLVRELEVNWPGVEIILRMRREILATHRQVSDLLDLVTRAWALHDVAKFPRSPVDTKDQDQPER